MRQLAPDLHACLVGDTPVLLDLSAGRYQMLRGATGRRLATLLQDAETSETLPMLADMGMMIPKDAMAWEARKGARLTLSHLQNACPQGAWLLFPVAMLLYLLAAVQVRRTSLKMLLADVQRGTPRAQTRATHWISEARISVAFGLLLRLLPLKDRCLPYSIALTYMLRLFGHRPTMIIGVRLPIAAHCWVQCESRIVGDSLQKVEAFEPILAI